MTTIFMSSKTLKYTLLYPIRVINLKYQLQHRIKNLNYLMYHILYHIFKIFLNMY